MVAMLESPSLAPGGIMGKGGKSPSKKDSASASAAKMPVNATRPAFPFMGLPPFLPASQPLGGLPDTMFLPGQ